MIKFDFNKAYTAEELNDIFVFPLFVRKDNYTDDFVFKIEFVSYGNAYGKTYKKTKYIKNTSIILLQRNFLFAKTRKT